LNHIQELEADEQNEIKVLEVNSKIDKTQQFN
jgi:hypothetical protein